MTEFLYLVDSYQKDFEAKIIKADGKLIFLDKTLFYPESGGQPSDSGKLICEGKECRVLMVKKLGTDIVHEVDRESLKIGDKVFGYVNWERRYRLMRMHTAAHVLSAVVHRETGALITGNKLDLEKSRIDFDLENFDRNKLAEYCAKANEIAGRGFEVQARIMKREEAMKIPDMVKLAGCLPPNIPELRIVSIGDYDIQADGGTHVKNTKEVGEIFIIDAENKGKNNRRVYFGLR